MLAAMSTLPSRVKSRQISVSTPPPERIVDSRTRSAGETRIAFFAAAAEHLTPTGDGFVGAAEAPAARAPRTRTTSRIRGPGIDPKVREKLPSVKGRIL